MSSHNDNCNQREMEIPPLSQQNIESAVTELRHHFDSGATRNDFHLRETLLHQLQTLLIEGQRLLESALFKDLHKHSSEYYLTEMQGVLLEIQNHIRNFRKWAQPKWKCTNVLNLPASSYVRPEPFGVVCIIGSWNFPVYLLLMPLVGAISSGNCTLLRLPDDDTCTHTIAALIHLFDKYVDTRYVQVVHGGIEETKTVLKQKFDLILGTGSEHLGRIVSRAAAEHLTPVILELGGKSPCVVDETAEIDLAARRIVWGAFLNAGQLCLRPDYLLVDKRVGEQLMEAIAKCIKQYFGADPLQSDSYGRVIHKRSFDRLQSILEKDGTFVSYGGKMNAEKLYISPTVLDYKSDLLHFERSSAMEKELFGPILPVFYYDSLEQVYMLIQNRPKPLTMSFFSNNKDRQRDFLSKTSSGSCCFNDVSVQVLNLNLPLGGVGNSGSGMYHGRYSFDSFSHHRAILYKSTWLDLPVRYPPYTEDKKRTLHFLVQVAQLHAWKPVLATFLSVIAVCTAMYFGA